MGCGGSQAAQKQCPAVITRVPCRDGAACKDFAATHRVKYCHPGDHDYDHCSSSSSFKLVSVAPAPAASLTSRIGHEEFSRISCKYGGDCKDFDKDHRSQYSHPGDRDFTARAPPVPDGTRKACKFGLRCFRRNDEHTVTFSHPGDRDYRCGLIVFEEGVQPEFETLRQLFDFCDPKEYGNFASKDDLRKSLELLAAQLPAHSTLPDANTAWKDLGGELDLHVGFARWALWAERLGGTLPVGVETLPAEGAANQLSCGFVFAGGRRCDCRCFTVVADTVAGGGSVQFCKCGHKRSMHASRCSDGCGTAASAQTPPPDYWSRHGSPAPGQVLVNLGADAVKMFQRLFDSTLKIADNWTRDRGCMLHGLKCPREDRYCMFKHKAPVPQGYSVVGVMHNMNRSLWGAYALNRGAVCKECEISTGGQPFRTVTDVKTVEVLLEDAPNVEGCNEWFLFHGTNSANVPNICTGGFSLSCSGTGCTWKDEGSAKGAPLYGDGIYFAESITKADEYSQVVESGPFAGCNAVLVCRVLGGRVQWCDTDEIDPALLQRQVISGPFHSVFGDRVTKLGKPYREIVVYDAMQVYPEYVVYYRRLYGRE